MIEFLYGMLILCSYFIICALIAVTCRKLFKIPDEIFRKILHFILLTSVFILFYAYDTWWISVITCIVFMVVVFPVLMLFESFKTYSKVVTERKKGELKISLLLVFSMFAGVIALTYGYFNDRLLGLAVIFSWGYGDALAALIGTKFGKYKIYKKKSLEGTLAMFITALITILVILFIRGMIPLYGIVVTAVITSLVVSIVELFTPNGLDTVTCPLASMVVMILLLMLFGGF